MHRTPAQLEHLAARTRNILDRITKALPDWTPEQLEVLAAQMADLEMRCEENARDMIGPRRR